MKDPLQLRAIDALQAQVDEKRAETQTIAKKLEGYHRENEQTAYGGYSPTEQREIDLGIPAEEAALTRASLELSDLEARLHALSDRAKYEDQVRVNERQHKTTLAALAISALSLAVSAAVLIVTFLK